MSSAIRTAGPERQNRLIFIGGILLAALAAVLIFVAVSGVMEEDGGAAGVGPTDSVNVVAASQEIEVGTRITGDMLSTVTLPANGIVEGAIRDEDDALQLEGLVVAQNMAKGEQFTAAKVGQEIKDEDKTLSAVVPPGFRAISVDVQENTVVGGFVVAGDRVDVIAILENEEGDSYALTLLQDIEVLAVAQDAQQAVVRNDSDGNPIETDTAEGSISTRPDDSSPNEDADTATLAVLPEDAARVALAEDEGDVRLVLRGQGDTEVLPIGPIDLQ